MTDCFILLLNRDMALIIFTSVIPVVEQEFCQVYIAVSMFVALPYRLRNRPKRTRACSISWWPSYHSFFTRSDVCNPAIGKLFGSIIESFILPFGKSIVIYCRFNENNLQHILRDFPWFRRPISISSGLYPGG